MNSITVSQNPQGNTSSPFDSIRHEDADGEFWYARELAVLLGYPRWADAEDMIDRAKAACKNAGNSLLEHFSGTSRKTIGRPKQDYRLSRFACYLIAQNGDPRKPEIAQAQTYFVVKTREAEVVIPAQNDRIRELELQIELNKVEQKLLDTRHLVVATCPEHVQQKILGYQVVEKIEYRDRVIKDNQVIDEGNTINKTEICKRFGILTKNGKPDFKQLNAYLQGLNLPAAAWEETMVVQHNSQLRVEYLQPLQQYLMNANRQTWIGESA